MPTGYTASVQDGTVTRFETFALSCARAFWALISMRDDPNDAAIPEKFTPSTYHVESLARSRAELARLEAMTPEAAVIAAMQDHEKRLTEWRERQTRRKEERARYDAMVAQVQAWEPPSSDHVELKDFMLQQLAQSIDFDCSDKYDTPPKPERGDAWRVKRIECERVSIERDMKYQAEEVARVEGRNRWVQQLRESLQAASVL